MRASFVTQLSTIISALCLAVSPLRAEDGSPPAATAEKDKNDAAANTVEPTNGQPAAAQPAEPKKVTKPEKKKVSLATFTLENSFPEGPGQSGLFGELELNLHKLIERLDQAAKDDKIAGVVLKLRSPEVGRGKIHEIRAAIARVRKGGKKVYADVHTTSGPDYLVALACDEIIMPPSGTLAVAGVRMEVVFFKDLLDKLGVKADIMQVGDFKGAAEPFTRNEMSQPLREQLSALVDDFYEQLVTAIAEDRKLDASKVRELIDQGVFTAAQAKEAGLIDHVAYEDELKERLKQELKADEIAIIKDYGKKQVDADFSGFAGMLKLMELMMGVEPSAKAGRNKKIAVVYAVGAIVPGKSSSGLLAETVGSDTVVKALRKAEEDAKVAAIVLRVDSPGGSALASDLIWREIVRIKKPIIASMGDVAASGGYYISMGADKIYAEPGTLTGSIGVVGGKVALQGLMDKVGVHSEVISRGKNSGWMSPTEPFTASEREVWMKSMAETYRQFTQKAAEGRKLDVQQIEKLAQGKVYSGRMAQTNKLVDSLGTLNDAIEEAKKLGGIAAGEKTDLLILPEQKSIFEDLFGGPEVESRLKAAAPSIAKNLGQLEILQRLFTEPSLTLLPFRVDVR